MSGSFGDQISLSHFSWICVIFSCFFVCSVILPRMSSAPGHYEYCVVEALDSAIFLQRVSSVWI